MSKNKIYGLDSPQKDSDAANKKYVDTGAIIGDGDRKRAPFLVLGLAP